MKKIITSVILFFIAITVVKAQQAKAPQHSKYSFSVYKIVHDPAAQSKQVSLLVKGDVKEIEEQVKQLGGRYKYAAGDIACISIPVNKLNALAENSFVQRIEGSEGKLKVLNDTSIFNNNVYLVQHGIDLPAAYNGEGVVVGIIDEGIDFNHKDLRDEQGHTRIKWLWDQRPPNDSNYTPQPYNYGQSFTNTQIDNLEAGVVVDHEYSHGTHVTGVAAGNGLAVNNYKGVAPKADIIFVAMNENASDNYFLSSLVDAIQYIFDKADSLGEPCSINISLGTYFGSHDGRDLQAQAIDNLITAKNGRIVTCAAGNEGSAPIHVHTDVTPDSEFTWLGGYPDTQSLYFQLWADSADIANVQFMVGVDQTTPSYDYRGGTGWQFCTATIGYDTQSVYNGPNRLGLVETDVESYSGLYCITGLITPDSAYYRWRFMTKGTGKFDMWGYDFVPADLPDSATFPVIVKYVAPDTWQNICSSFTCSDKVITVGSYINRNFYADCAGDYISDSTEIVGKISDFSSHGPTRDGRIKPEITSTGEWVLSCAAQYDLLQLYVNAPGYIAAGCQHRIGNGTSFASPAVAGIAALYLQKNPTASWQQVKNAVISCTRTDNFTGTTLPNNIWGYGKVDAYKVIKGCGLGVNEAVSSNVHLENYPNPFSDVTTIDYDFSYANKRTNNAIITISDAFGRKVRDIVLKGLEGSVTINKNEIGSGLYFYSLILDGKIVRTNKMIVM